MTTVETVSAQADGPLSPADRAARGRALRRQVTRSAHAALDPPDRDPVDLLERQAAGRVPELLPVRYGRMLLSPLSFLRGGALLMAADLAGAPRTGLTVQLCGDAHLSNFGMYGTPERRLVFDVNDFDETMAGPWEWDVKRLAASLAVAAAHRGFTAKQSRRVVLGCVERYRLAMREFARMGHLAVWYTSPNAAAIRAVSATRSQRRTIDDATARALRHNSARATVKLTRRVGGLPRIVADPPLIVPIDDLLPGAEHERLLDNLTGMVDDYLVSLRPERADLLRQYRVVDAAHKVVGVGSVGKRAWILLLIGRDARDPLMLQAKEAGPSVLAGFLGAAGYDNEGERVVTGQRMMQTASDIFLGWHRSTDLDGVRRDYYLRQLRDWKGSADVEVMDPDSMCGYGALCGWTLARAHARTGDRIAIAAYLGSGDAFERAVTRFAEAYAERNGRDYDALRAAVRSGRVTARTDL
ncbi:MAG TPA: DUF2252 domain-containing protein [Kribbellaceae bacterium]|nr:DUF2252 domain-containing protein [Kribbellaceae bacterium]